MKSLAEMTAAERAALTQEALDAMLQAKVESYKGASDSYRVTLEDLRRYEPSFSKPLPRQAPPSHEANLWLTATIDAEGEAFFGL